MSEEIKGNLVLPKKAQLQILHRHSVLDFGIMALNEEKSLKFSIKNCGEETLEANFEITEGWISINPSHISGLNKGETKEIEVKASPKNVKLGKQKLHLIIKSNDLLEKTKKILILLHIQEKVGNIELHPPSIELIKISPKQETRTKIEVKNINDESEMASVEVEVDPKDADWLSYEISAHKNQLYINLNINPKNLTEEKYDTKIKVRELFSPYALPIEVPISFTIAPKTHKITSKLKEGPSKEKVGDFIKGLIYEEKEEENDDILYTDQKSYRFKPATIIILGIIVFAIIFLALYLK